MLLFANDVVLLQENEEDISQKSMDELRKLSTIYNFKISAIKTKVTAFRGECPIRSKITIDNKSNTEKAFDFDCLLSLLLLWLYSPLFGLGRFFSFLNLYTIGRAPWTGDQPAARPLPTRRTKQTQNKRTQYKHPCLEWDSNPRSQRPSG
jgi:hypothetical protein